MMRALLLGCIVCVTALANLAEAYNLKPLCDRSELYCGIQGGFGWLTSRTHNEALPAVALLSGTQRPYPHGWFAGGQVGWNVCCWHVMGGIEADFSGGRIARTTTHQATSDSGLPSAAFVTTTHRTDWFGTVRPRLGYLLTPCLFLYGTGGLAYAHTHYKANINLRPTGVPFTFPVSFAKVKVGWTAGGGLEYILCGNWSVKGEYLFFDLDKESKTGNPQPTTALPPTEYTFKTRGHLFKAGLNYRFHL